MTDMNRTGRMVKASIWIVGMLIMTMPMAAAQIPFACFADGEVFNADGSPVMPGVKVTLKNLDTNETRNTSTGFPNYPPVDMYNNDYKFAFTCTAGKDTISVKAWNETHYGYGKIVVPADSQAWLNITLDKEINNQKKGLTDLFKRIIDYFMGKI